MFIIFIGVFFGFGNMLEKFCEVLFFVIKGIDYLLGGISWYFYFFGGINWIDDGVRREESIFFFLGEICV